MNLMNDHAQDPARLPKPRRDYKDTLFRLLFRDRNRLLSLYNAVNGTSCSSPEDLTVVTLENAVYMNMKNDVLFCQTLKEYMLFVERVRLHAKTMTVGAAVHRAVTECIREGILSDFLSQNRVEVIAVSIFEYDEERELALMRKAIASEARKEGNNEGREDEIKSLIRTKLRKGKSIPQIADELERDETTIKALIQGMGDEVE